jgi:hypothetical protein
MSDHDLEASDGHTGESADADYKVGYGKPPKQHQFKKGAKSPNPKGRPKGAKGLKTILCAAAEAPAEYILHGKKTKAQRIEVAAAQLTMKAAKGELKAIDKLMQLYSQYGPPSAVDESMIDAEADAATMDELLNSAAKFSRGAT